MSARTHKLNESKNLPYFVTLKFRTLLYQLLVALIAQLEIKATLQIPKIKNSQHGFFPRSCDNPVTDKSNTVLLPAVQSELIQNYPKLVFRYLIKENIKKQRCRSLKLKTRCMFFFLYYFVIILRPMTQVDLNIKF